MKEYLKSRQYLQEEFLRNKEITYEECTERQKNTKSRNSGSLGIIPMGYIK